MNNEEQIRQAINNLDETTAKDALALILANKKETPQNIQSIEKENDFKNFSQAIEWLKRKFKFKELDAFSTEADLVYVNTGDRRVLLTDTMIESKTLFQKENAEKEKTTDSEGNSDTDIDNAFEPLKKNGRFSNLEL